MPRRFQLIDPFTPRRSVPWRQPSLRRCRLPYCSTKSIHLLCSFPSTVPAPLCHNRLINMPPTPPQPLLLIWNSRYIAQSCHLYGFNIPTPTPLSRQWQQTNLSIERAAMWLLFPLSFRSLYSNTKWIRLHGLPISNSTI